MPPSNSRRPPSRHRRGDGRLQLSRHRPHWLRVLRRKDPPARLRPRSVLSPRLEAALGVGRSHVSAEVSGEHGRSRGSGRRRDPTRTERRCALRGGRHRRRETSTRSRAPRCAPMPRCCPAWRPSHRVRSRTTRAAATQPGSRGSASDSDHPYRGRRRTGPSRRARTHGQHRGPLRRSHD